MEQLLHYVWKHRLLPAAPLATTDGRPVEVIDAGLLNAHQGPDFFNAKVKIGGVQWVGNVEIHLKSSDWYAHGHHEDARYDTVVLHVTACADAEVVTSKGETLPQLVVGVPDYVERNYRELLTTLHYPPCYKLIPGLASVKKHAWIAALQTERLEQKTRQMEHRAQRCGGSWEDAYFITLARNYGFGVNGDAFEQWALNVPLQAVGKHRDDLFQVETLFMGQAGLLQADAMAVRHREAALTDAYFLRMSAEYAYLSHKFGLSPIDYRQWRFLRLRPQNFPHIRLSQLARLYHERRAGLSELLECKSAAALRTLLTTAVTPYWQTHYMFGQESAANAKQLSDGSLNLIIINTAIPTLFAVGRHRQRNDYCERAYELLEQLKAERNHIVEAWKACGLEAHSAGDSQALLQLKTEYCDKKECLRCRFGSEYLKSK